MLFSPSLFIHLFFFQNPTSMEDEVLQREARKGMTGDEAEFSVESALDNQIYLWSDKYLSLIHI